MLNARNDIGNVGGAGNDEWKYQKNYQVGSNSDEQ